MKPVLPTSGGLPETWRVRLPVFEGPLDLLLHLIRMNEVEITDIPVAPICDQFHEYLRLMEKLDLDVAGDYIYMAAYLIQLKSKMLLPLPKPDPETGETEDPRRELVERLLEYRRIKEAAQTLAEVESLRHGMWPRKSDEIRRVLKTEEEVDLGDLSLFDLLKTFREVLDRFGREHPDPIELRAETYSVRDQIRRFHRTLSATRPIDFLDDLRALSCRQEAIAAFLAVLEMVRLQIVRLHRTPRGTLLLYRTTRTLSGEELEAIEA